MRPFFARFLMKTLLFVSLIVSQVPVWAGSFASKNPTIPPIPELQVQSTELGNVSEPFSLMGFTRGVRPQASENFKLAGSEFDTSITKGFVVYPNIDLVQFETQVLRSFALGQGIFAEDKDPIEARGIAVLRYGVNNEAVDAFFKWAKESGLHSTVLVTDGPISTDASKATFPTKIVKGEQRFEDFTNDIRPEYLSTKGNGASLRKMLEQGYKLYSPVLPRVGEMIPRGSFFFAMSALANPKLDRVPIMHEKEVVMYILKDPALPAIESNIKKIYVMHGSGNWTNVHVNRNFVYKDDLKVENGQMGLFAFRHAIETLEAFTREGKSARIKDIPTVGRKRVVAKDGSFWESAYTDGRFELNQRIADELNVLAGDLETIQRLAKGDEKEVARLVEYSKTTDIEAVTLEHFVLTNGRVVDALVNLMRVKIAQGKPFPVTGVLDAQFVGLRTFGMGAVFAGYDVWTDFGKKLQGLGPELQKWVRLAVQMEEIPDSKNINPDGAPFWRVLAHGKTTMIKMLRGANKERWTWLATGSYNNSNNYNNLERQDVQFLKGSDPLAASMDSSIRTLVADQLAGVKKALPLDKAVYVLAIAQFVGHSPVDIDWVAVEKLRVLIDGLHKGQGEKREAAMAQIEAIAMQTVKIPSRMIPKYQVSEAQLRTRLGIMSRFFRWYLQQPSYRQGFKTQVNANEMLGLALAIQEKPFSAKRALRSVLWQPYATDEILETRAFRVFSAMKLENMFFDKFVSQGLSPEEAKKESRFPWFESNVFNAEVVSELAVKKSVEEFMAGRIDKIAAILKKEIASRTEMTNEKMDLAASDAVITARLVGFRRMLVDYRNVPKDPNFKYPLPTFTDAQLVTQLLSESLDLVMLKDQPAERLKKTVMYLYALKGYRDNRDKTPGPLTALTEKALEVLVRSEGPVVPKVVADTSLLTVLSSGLRCAGVLGK